MRFLLLNDNSAHNNWGAQATPPALEFVLRSAEPAAELSWLSHAWLRTEYVRVRGPLGFRPLYRVGALPGINNLMRRVSHETEFFPTVADDFDWFTELWLSGRGGPPAHRFLDLARNTDAVIHNGENSIYRNTTEACRATFLLYLTKTALGKPACAVNVTAQLDDVQPVLPAMVRKTYPLLDLVATREPASLRNLRTYGVENARGSADVVFGLGPARTTARFERWKESAGPRGDYFCLSASALPASVPRGDWDGEVVELVRGLLDLGISCVLVAKDTHNQFLREVARRTGSHFFGPEHEFEDMWPLFKGAEFLVTGHFHYAIAATMVGCPFIPLSTNNHKMAGLCELVGGPLITPFDITDLASCREGIVGLAREVIGRRREHRERLLARVVQLRDAARETGRRLAALVAPSSGEGAD